MTSELETGRHGAMLRHLWGENRKKTKKTRNGSRRFSREAAGRVSQNGPGSWRARAGVQVGGRIKGSARSERVNNLWDYARPGNQTVATGKLGSGRDRVVRGGRGSGIARRSKGRRRTRYTAHARHA